MWREIINLFFFITRGHGIENKGNKTSFNMDIKVFDEYLKLLILIVNNRKSDVKYKNDVDEYKWY